MKAVSASLVAACAVVAHVTVSPHSGFAVRDHSRNDSSPLHVEVSSGSKGIVIATVANNGSSDLNFLKLGNFPNDKNPVRKVHIGSASGKPPKI